MSKALLVSMLALGIGLSAANGQSAEDKSGTPSAGTTAEKASAQTTPAPRPTPIRSGGAAPAARDNAMEQRIRRYSQSLLKQYDKNNNGVLEKDEWQKMPDRWHAADRNGDGTIPVEELVAFAMQRDGIAPERRGETVAPSLGPRASRPGPAGDAGGPRRLRGETTRPQPTTVAPVPEATQPTRFGSRTSQTERPLDPRAPLVSVQLVMVEVAPESDKAGTEAKVAPSSLLAGGAAMLEIDLSAPSEKILDELRKLGVRGRLDVFCRIQLAAADRQAASFQVDGRVPQVIGVNMSQFGQSNNVNYLNTGLKVEILPEVAGNTVLAEVSLDGSRLGRADDGIPLSTSAKGEVVARAAPIHSCRLKTTVNVGAGKTIVLGGMTENDGKSTRQLVLLLCPRIVPVAPSQTAPAAR